MPSYDDNSVTYTEELIKCLKGLCIVNWPVIVTGDFNCPAIDWSVLTAPRDRIQNVFLDFVCDVGLEQMVTLPTRGENILDLVLTSHPLLLSKIDISEPFGTSTCSDHNVVEFTIDVGVEQYQPGCCTVKHYLWNKADYDAISTYLINVDWDYFISVCLTPDSLWSGFCDIMFTAFDLYVPCKYVTGINTRRLVRKYPSRIRKTLNRKRCLWRFCRDHPNDDSARSKYRALQAECRRIIHEYELDKETKIIQSGNTSKFYKYTNSKLSRPSGVGSLQDSNGDMVTDNTAKANLLNAYFSSVNESDNGVSPTFEKRVSDDVHIDNIVFTPDNVIKVFVQT
jgi:hypothetical protein